jgi:hypothetical protein
VLKAQTIVFGSWGEVHCGKNVVDDADIFMVDEIGYIDAHNLMARLCRLKDNKEGTDVFNVIDVTTGSRLSLL